LSGPGGDGAGLAQVLSAGRYAAFVWPAYGVTALGFAWMIIDTLARARRWRRRTETLEKSGDS
jgi:heme exporter protein D